MSSTTDPWNAVADARASWRRADDELPRLRAVHGDLSTTLDALRRNKPGDAAITEALDSVERLGGESDDRRAALDFLTEPVLDGGRAVQAAFQQGRGVMPAADAVASALTGYVDGGSWSAVTSAVTDLLQPPDGPMAIDTSALEQVVALFGIAIEAGIAAREERADSLQSVLADAYEETDTPIPEIDEQPITLLPVRLETRFVDQERTTNGDLSQLLIRVYPDQIHGDSHEEELTDDEVLWGQNFWATLWYARHPDQSVVPDDPSASYLQERLPNQRLCELVAGIDDSKFSDAHHKRYRECKERAWKQLLDRFSRERAAYIVHALEPTDDELAGNLVTRPEAPRQPPDGSGNSGDGDGDSGGGSGSAGPFVGSLDTDAVAAQLDDETMVEGFDTAGAEPDLNEAVAETETEIDASAIENVDLQPTESLPEKLPELSFPSVPRKPESWTQQPRAALLPDRWIAIAEWETASGETKRNAVEGDPIREPLPLGPSPESVAEEELAGQGTDSPAQDRTEWMVEFDDAEAVGMGLRLRLTSLSGFDPHRGFSKLTVVGVKASMDTDRTPEALSDLIDAHHYTDGLEFLPQGTPTNNHDESSGYSRSDDPLESMGIEAGEPLVESGDRSDGDLLARALAIDSETDHVFEHIENAGETEQRDARHMNSALWPATLGYLFQDLMIHNDLTSNPSVFGGGMGKNLTGSDRRQRLNRLMLWHDAYRRHFVRYVRGRGPFPALRVGKQPYGILPAKAIETEREVPILDQQLVADLELGNRTIEDVQAQGTDLDTLVNGGVDSTVLMDAGAKPQQLLEAGAEPDELMSGGVEPRTIIQETNLTPDSLTQDGIGLLKTSRVTRSRLESAGVPVEDLQQRGVTVRALSRGEVSDEQLEEAGVTTRSVAEVLLPRQAKSLGITPSTLEKAGVTPGALLRGELSAEQVEALGLSSRAVADVVLPDAVRDMGITPKKIEDAGVSPRDLINGSVSAEDLEKAGVTPEALAEALLPQELVEFGITPEQVGEAVDLADLFNGDVGVEDLETAGLNTQNLADALLPQSFRDAGITPETLESAGITPAAVLNGQVSPEDIVEAGVTPDALAEAGVLPDVLSDVGSVFGDLLDAGLKPMELLEEGLSPKALVDAGVDPQMLVEAGIAPKRLVDAGLDVAEIAAKGTVPVQDLLEAGASPQQLARLGAAVEDLSGGEVPAQELVQAGFTAFDLLEAGADALGVAEGGSRPSQLRDAGVDAGTLREAGKAAGSLRSAGYTAEELLDTGYTVEELLNGGFSQEELSAAGVEAAALEGAGRAVDELLAAGHPPERLRANGYGADQLLDAGLDVASLVAAGYTAGELKDAGVSTQQLVEAGMDPSELRAAGTDSKALADAGVDARTLKDTGAAAEDLLDHGFEPQELLDAGFASVELEVAGVDVDQLAEDVVEGEADTGDVADAALSGLQYAATVLEDPDQAERDLYSFSFDPAVPKLPEKADVVPGDDTEGTEAGETDGGVAAGVPVVRPLSIDDQLPGDLRGRLRGLGKHWSEAAANAPFSGATDEGGVLNALKREGLSADIRQQTMAFSAEPTEHYDWVNQQIRYLYGGGSPIQSLTQDMSEGAVDLDPRIGHFRLEDISREEIEAYQEERGETGRRTPFYRYLRTFDRQGTIEPHEMVDADVTQFIDVLLESSFSDVRKLSHTISVKPDNLNADAIEGIDGWSGLTDEERRQKIVNGLENADDPNTFVDTLVKDAGSGFPGRSKLYQLAENQTRHNDSGALRSLLRLLLQYGTLQEYVAARRRLGLAYDDVPDAWPDPAYYDGQNGPLETLRGTENTAPKALRSHPNIGSMATVGGDAYDYVDALQDAALDYTSTTSIDPRISEFTDSLRYLGGLEPHELATLARETLDLSSHRLDAWWTSLATKDLFELREAQGSYDTESGFDHEKWSGGGSDVPRATIDPGLLSNVTLETGAGDDSETEGTGDVSGGVDSTVGSDVAAGGSDSAVEFDPAVIADMDIQLESDTTSSESQPDGGFDATDAEVDLSGVSSDDEQSGQDAASGASGQGSGTVDLSTLQEAGQVATRDRLRDPSKLDSRVQSDPGVYVGGYGFVEDLSADVEGQDGPEYIQAPSEQHATTAAVLRSGAEAHDADEGENLLEIDLSAERVRTGMRLIRGVRRGQSLSALLGYRFERRLREKTLAGDADVMQYADVFRVVFPAKLDKMKRPDEVQSQGKTEGKEDLARRDVVDGRKLVENWSDYPFERGDSLPETGTDKYQAIDDIVSELADEVDAAGDLLTAESVHQLGQGNYEQAGGSVDALAKGEPLPDPSIARTPRSEIGLTHRQCLLFGTPTSEVGATPRSRAEPALSAWVGELLPGHDSVECLATLRWTETTTDVDGNETEVEQSHETSVTLAELDLDALDVLLLFGADRQPARSELEQRLVYHLIRDRPDSPAVPADAEVELELTETETSDAIPMSDLLELTRSIRELVQAARPVNAEDLAHPTDQAGEGYDVSTADTLAARANTAQDRLLSVTREVDERLSVLDSDHQQGDAVDDLDATDVASTDGGNDIGSGQSGGSWDNLGGGVSLPGENAPVIDTAFTVPDPTVTEQASDLVDAIEAVDDEVPLSTAESVANSIDAGSIRDELSALLDTLPAGLADPNAVRADVTVESATGQSVAGMLGEPVEVPDVGTGDETDGADGDGGTSDDGEDGSDGADSSGPIAWVPEGGQLDTTIPGSTGGDSDDTIDMADLPETEYTGGTYYGETLDSVTLSEGSLQFGGTSDLSGGDSGETGDDGGDTDDTSGGDDTEPTPDWSTATATIRAWGTDGLSWFERETTTTPDADGSFSVDLDFSDVDPGTPFQVVAIVDGTVVYSGTGRVVGDVTTSTQSVLENDCPNLRQLLWLRARQPLYDTLSGSAADLDLALSLADFDAMGDERDAADPSSSPITTEDIDAVDDMLAVEGTDPGALASAVDTAVGPVSRLGLDRIVDVAGEGGPSDVAYWYGPTEALSDVRARITRLLANPALYNAGVAPWLLSYHHDSAALLHGMDGGDEIAAYLDAFLSAPPWLVRYLDEQIEAPATLIQELSAWLYTPSEVADTGDLATSVHDLATVVTDLPALAVLFRGLPTVDDNSSLKTFKIHLQGLASTMGTGAPAIPDPSPAGSTFDADASAAMTDLASDAHSVESAISPVVGSEADRSFRRIVLERLREPMTVAASYGVFGGTPRSPDGGAPDDEVALVEQARALLKRLRTRLTEAAALDPRLVSGQSTRPVPQRVEDQTDRLQTLFGDGFTVLPPFTPSNGAELTATFTDGQLVPDDDSMAAETWLQRAASFRDNVDSFREARTYSETIDDKLTTPLTIGQVPYESGDTWVGVDGVEPAAGKLSLVAQFPLEASPGSTNAPMTGLFVDEYTEGVPESTETSGVALNYDDPGMRAPQSVLVAMPPDDGEWTLDDLAATVAETSEYMKRRAMDMGDVDEAARLFPGLYFASQRDPTPSTPTVAFEMLDWYDRQIEMRLLKPNLIMNFEEGSDDE
ncbi:MAG: hypothetical protein V5A21_01260 [Halapricum sp.]